MAGSLSPTLWRELGLARGQSSELLQQDAASKIVNLAANPLGGLSTADGFCPLEPTREQPPISGTPYGVFQARLHSVYQMTLARFGSVLYEHRGDTRSWFTLVTGLTDSVNNEYPDQFVQVGETIIWNNGVDRARQIAMNGMVAPLGFYDVPASPAVIGPESPTEGDKVLYYNNSLGLSWPGNIGTASPAMYGAHGKLMVGTWRYAIQFEDCFGNLSKISPVSSSIRLGELSVKPFEYTDLGAISLASDGASVHDLMKMFCLHTEDNISIDTLYRVHVLRTKNTRFEGNEFYQVASFAATSGVTYGDRTSDGNLGPQVESHESTPIFRHMTSLGDRLIIANTTLQPNVIMVSDQGFPGTFRTRNKLSAPHEVTAVKAHGGKVFVWTASTIYELVIDEMKLIPISAGVGCVAHKSVASLADGSMIWLGDGSFYQMTPAGAIEQLGSEMKELLRVGLNKVRVRKAVAWIDPTTESYMIALPRAGSQVNELVLCYHGAIGWSEFNYGIIMTDVCTGVTKHVLCAGKNGSEANVFVMNRETPTYTPPTRVAKYRTHWLRVDPAFRESFSLRNFILTFLETGNFSITVRVFRNQIYAPVAEQTFLLYDLPINDVTKGTWFNSSFVVGTNKLRTPRIASRWLSLNDVAYDGSTDVHCCMIEIECTYPNRMHLLSLAYTEQPPQTVREIEGRLIQATTVE